MHIKTVSIIFLSILCSTNPLSAQWHRDPSKTTGAGRLRQNSNTGSNQGRGLFSFLRRSSTPLPRITPEQRETQRRPWWSRGDSSSRQGEGSMGGHDITICLPSDRNKMGSIRFGMNRCAVKGKGAHSDRTSRRGDTPTGVYRVTGLGGNSRGQWGTKGLHIVATWSGSTNQRGERGRGNSTSDLFIHTRSYIRNASTLAGRSTWGCPLIPWDCMIQLQNYYRSRGPSSNMTVNITERCI